MSARQKTRLRRAAADAVGFVADSLAQMVPFAEQAYLKARPDVAVAIDHGVISSGLRHCVAHGWRERFARRGDGDARATTVSALSPAHTPPDDWSREPPEAVPSVVYVPPDDWDEDAYLYLYPEVARAVKCGAFRSGYEHWRDAGETEGRRLPPRGGVVAPPTWDDERYLAAYPDVRASIAEGFVASGYAHWWAYGQREGRRLPLAIPAWLKTEMREIAAIEPKLYPSETFFAELTQHQPAIHCEAGVALTRVLAKLPPRSFTHVFLLPWLKRGGADLVALHHIRTLCEKYGASVLVITTELADSPWSTRLPTSAFHLEAGAEIATLTAEGSIRLLARLLLKVRAPIIHNINSGLGWETFATYGCALKQASRLYASLFCYTLEEDGGRAGYARLLDDVWQHLSGVITDNQDFADRMADESGIQRSLFINLRYPTACGSRFKYTGLAAPRVLWAGRFDWQKRPDLLCDVAAAMPGVVFDVYGAPMLDSTDCMDQVAMQLTRLPNVNMLGPFDGFDSIPAQDYICLLYTSRYDGLPNIVLEALASGLCVLAPDCGGIREAVGASSPFLLRANATCEDYTRTLRWATLHPAAVAKERAKTLRFMKNAHSYEQFQAALALLPGYTSAASESNAVVPRAR